MRAGLLALLCAVLPVRLASAQEDVAAKEVAEGEKLAKAGLFAESIARFKAAEVLAPHAANDCLIGLSYMRLRKLGQADLFMQRCAARATGADPAPSWLVTMASDLKTAITSAGLSAVTIAIEPADAAARARLTCSDFAPDEIFAPGTIHLPPGEHTVRARADRFAPAEKKLSVAGGQAVVVELTLEPTAALSGPATRVGARPGAAGSSSVTASPAPEGQGRGPWPYVTLGVAGAALIGGVVLHVKALDTKDKAESNIASYNQLANDYESQRTFTYTLYTVAIIGGAVGTWLWFRSPSDGDGGFQASAAATPEGAFVNLGWRQ